jgi:hypothetical protein
VIIISGCRPFQSFSPKGLQYVWDVLYCRECARCARSALMSPFQAAVSTHAISFVRSILGTKTTPTWVSL